MNVARLKIPTLVFAVVALVIGVSSGAVAAKLITGKDIKDGSLTTKDIKNGTLTTQDIKKASVGGDRLKNGAVGTDKLKANAVNSSKIKDGSVGAKDLAPGAVAFPQTLWGPMIRNQQGAGQSTLVTGPGTPPMGTGSLELTTTGNADLAAFGDSVDFAGDTTGKHHQPELLVVGLKPRRLVGPSLRIEINPHLVPDSTPGGVFEFTTLIYDRRQLVPGWVTHSNIQDDAHWSLTGTRGDATGCTAAEHRARLAAVIAALVNANDGRPRRRLPSAPVSTSAMAPV